MSLSLPLSAVAQRRERAASGFRLVRVPRRLLLAADARFAERHLGLGRAVIRIERERQRLRHRFADVDQRAVIEDHVHLAFMELDLLVRRRPELRAEEDVEILFDRGWNRRAGDWQRTSMTSS